MRFLAEDMSCGGRPMVKYGVKDGPQCTFLRWETPFRETGADHDQVRRWLLSLLTARSSLLLLSSTSLTSVSL